MYDLTACFPDGPDNLVLIDFDQTKIISVVTTTEEFRVIHVFCESIWGQESVNLLDQVTDVDSVSDFTSDTMGETRRGELSKIVSVDVVGAVIYQKFRMMDISTEVEHLGSWICDLEQEFSSTWIEMLARSIITQHINTSTDDSVLGCALLNLLLKPSSLWFSEVTLLSVWFVTPKFESKLENPG